MSDKPTIEDVKAQLSQTDEVNQDGIKAIIENAIKTAESGDAGALLEQMVIDALSEVRAIDEAQYVRYKSQINPLFKKSNVATIRDLDKLTRPPKKPRSEADSGRESKADLVISLVKQEAEFYHDSENECWIRCKIPNKPIEGSTEDTGHHFEVYNLKSEGFTDYAERLFHHASGGVVGESAMKDIIDGLRYVARWESDECEVHLRYATYEDIVYINMANDTWQVVEVTKEGWQIKEGHEVPVLFTCDKYMHQLPIPERGSSIGILWDAMPIKDQDDRNRLVGWMINAMLTDTDYLLCELTGTAGAVKSGIQKVVVSLIDPNAGDLLMYSKLDDVPVMAKGTHVLSYDNLSIMSSGFKDMCCSILTGSAFGTRTLHKTSERSLWQMKRPIIINGIPHLAVGRDDLTQRTIRVEVPTSEVWKSKVIFIKKWKDDLRPKALGALYDLLSGVLRELETSTIIESTVTRQVDLLREGQAVYDALNIDNSYELTMKKMQDEQAIESIESCPVTMAIISMMKDKAGRYEGTTTQLLKVLGDPHKGYKPTYIDHGKWPKDYHSLSSILRRQTALLKRAGIVFERTKSGNKRPLVFTYIAKSIDDNSSVDLEF